MAASTARLIAERVFGDERPAAGWRASSGREWAGASPPGGRRSTRPIRRRRAAVVEVPLLFESGMEAVFDKTIAVVAAEALARSARAARGHAAVASAPGASSPRRKRRERADFEVRNDGSLAELRRRCPAYLRNSNAPMSSDAARRVADVPARPGKAPAAGGLAVAGLGRALRRDRRAWASDALREITLPLNTRTSFASRPRDKDLDAALIAAVIYEESQFRDQTSVAGARGLMQITPGPPTHRGELGRHPVRAGRPGRPQINIAYGAWYLDLLDHYGGNDRWR